MSSKILLVALSLLVCAAPAALAQRPLVLPSQEETQYNERARIRREIAREYLRRQREEADQLRSESDRIAAESAARADESNRRMDAARAASRARVDSVISRSGTTREGGMAASLYDTVADHANPGRVHHAPPVEGIQGQFEAAAPPPAAVIAPGVETPVEDEPKAAVSPVIPAPPRSKGASEVRRVDKDPLAELRRLTRDLP